MISPEQLAAIPKAELHCHLEGALDVEMLWAFSQRHEPGRYASLKDFREAVTVPKGVAPGFKSFLARFNVLRFHYGTADDIEALAAESIWYLNSTSTAYYREVRFSPVFFARRLLKGKAANDTQVPLSLAEDAATAVIRGVHDAVDKYGFQEEYIVTCNVGLGYAVNKPALDLLHRPIGRRIKGIDLAGDESADASDFIKPFLEWKEAGKIITIHAGEDPDAAGPRNVIAALDVFKADRIGHGVRAIEDPELVARLAHEQIPLEICPTSNIQTRAVSCESAHPLKRLFDAGLCVTISTDDPVICGTTLDDEYAFASRLGLSADNLMECTLNSVRSGILPEEDKTKLAQSLQRFYAQLGL